MSSEIITLMPISQISGSNHDDYRHMRFINDQIFQNTILFIYFISMAIIVAGYLYSSGILNNIFNKSTQYLQVEKHLDNNMYINEIKQNSIDEIKQNSIDEIKQNSINEIKQNSIEGKKEITKNNITNKEYDKKSDLMSVD